MSSVHDGHRDRMKARFLAEGLDSFSEHNVLELLLFYSIPRKDTNEIAHALINRFGSLNGVLEASVEELTTVPGVGEHSAILIHCILPIAYRYIRAHADASVEICDTVEKLVRYAKMQYTGIRRETTKLLLLDNALRILDCVDLTEGSADRTDLDARRIVEVAIRRGAPMVVLMHNHPGGRRLPSGEDYEATLRLCNICEAVGIRLLEHLLIAEEVTPILHWARSSAGKEYLANEGRSLQAEK